jgi:uncharacterized cupin superfamily protein
MATSVCPFYRVTLSAISPATLSHAFENTGSEDLVIWAFGNRFRHEVCIYPGQGIAFVEGLGVDVPLAGAVASQWTEERRKR